VMDSVMITAVVRSTEGPGLERSPVELRATTTISGVGEEDPREWLRDALIGLLEAL
jgi:hypothetical protein